MVVLLLEVANSSGLCDYKLVHRLNVYVNVGLHVCFSCFASGSCGMIWFPAALDAASFSAKPASQHADFRILQIVCADDEVA